ncbi:MAG: Gfo/Idh/MocA family oxidoreductase [Candidatus Hydrogenedentes bacterium]|nr:Gfo/Idh/MocA family oxidoreductase [Candidatus Hydrogenedentota bacterium]
MDKQHSSNPSRRQFIYTAGAVTAATLAAARPQRKAYGATPLGANDRIGVGMVGCGGRGRHLTQTVLGCRDAGTNCDMVAVCDIYRPRMESLAAKANVKGYISHHELLADPNVDVVGVPTPDHIHGSIVIDAIKAGKDVYCEKPFTHWRQHELTKQVVEVVKNSKQIFTLGTQGMSDAAWTQMKKLIKEGLIGQPIHAECGYFRVGDWGERGMPIDDPNAQPGPDLNWEAFLGDAPKRPFDVSRFFRWRMYEDYSGGPSTDLFPHSLTPVIYMLGLKMPELVVGLGGKMRYQEREVPDTFNMMMNYPEKITVLVLGTQGNDYSGTGARGSGGRVPVVRGWDGTLTVQGSEIVFFPADKVDKKETRVAIEHDEHLGRHWDNLFECCRTRQQAESPIDLALYVQTALQMAMLAMREGVIARYEEGKIIA